MNRTLSFLCPLIVSCLVLGNAAVWGKNLISPSSLVFERTEVIGAEFQLQANQAPVNLILDKITAVTGVILHRTVLPQDPITATCVGSSVKAILDCLFNHKTAMIARYAEDAQAQKNPTDQLKEIWIMGSDYGLDNKQCVTAMHPVSSTDGATQSLESMLTLNAENLDVLLKKAKSTDITERMNAVAGLGRSGEAGNSAIQATLQNALQDVSPQVRAQALNSIVSREGEGAVYALENALHDPDLSVRMMAVDVAGNNKNILEQAMADTSKTVREYAATKLAGLSE